MKPLIVDVAAQISRRLPPQHHASLRRIVASNQIQGNANLSFFARCLWIAPSFLPALSCISVLLQHLPQSDVRQSLLCSAWLPIGTAVLCREPGVLVQLREMVRTSSWVVVRDMQDWLLQEEASERSKDAKSATTSSTSSPTVSNITVIASPIEGTGTRRASSIALAGLTASPSNVNQSIKRRLSVAQMSSMSSSGGGGAGTKEEDTLEMQRFWRFCDAMLASFGEEAVLDSFL
jgi:hypothetical protein